MVLPDLEEQRATRYKCSRVLKESNERHKSLDLARLKTATGRDQLSKLSCEVNTMLFCTEKILLEHLPCPDSSNKTEIGGMAVPFVCLSVASKPSQHPRHSCLVVLLTHRDLQPCRAPCWALSSLLQVMFFLFPTCIQVALLLQWLVLPSLFP